MFSLSRCESSIRRSPQLIRPWSLTAILTCVAVALMLAPPVMAAKGRPGGDAGGGGGKGGGNPVPSPDIVYMSDDNSLIYNAGVRGITLASDGLGSTDTSLQKSKSGRHPASIALSPDGTKMAWIETGLNIGPTDHSIIVGTPGKKPVVIFASSPGEGQPQIMSGSDGLAWGPAVSDSCETTEESLLVFTSTSPLGIFTIRFVNGQPGEPEPLLLPQINFGSVPSAYAFSPTGQHLAFSGSAVDASMGLWVLPLCGANRTPVRLIADSDIGNQAWGPPIMAIDWSRDGQKLALSVTTGTEDPWRDLMIASLPSYGLGANGIENTPQPISPVRIDLDGLFGAHSSEHSPKWGPVQPESSCQRIAFSQSSDAAPRAMYLLDINALNGIGGCEINSPLQINAKNPRALDWK